MTLFTVPMNNFLVKVDGDNKTYIGMETDASRAFIISEKIEDTKYATLEFTYDLSTYDTSGFDPSTEAEFQEGIDFLQAGLLV